MSEFLALLALYYACDVTAATRPPTAAQATQCMAHYEAVKSYFSPLEPTAEAGTPERAAQDRAAYRGFKAWEANNADLVSDLRAQVRS